mmetsp:Transcript_35263/g.59431  ORF Transcript_35263/g.59431 Transcript_35263/m.59431 type:complete len:1530 (-) Transcript_35263:238-4827(-)|eukprot:CAMPEP_0198201278 /NCGR_PEP_ID=MMETSP1445-20131203/4008_1 /TAXON_ID=36898 /ORGANISM="Pyramimonas sp., Strain CCMP2087" /LENGTH=1529 /DNA_ID=CAMNT_0043871497 /DNA_START=191 /DNA_END=4780 /DNA_ORIENTATION=+
MAVAAVLIGRRHRELEELNGDQPCLSPAHKTTESSREILQRQSLQEWLSEKPTSPERHSGLSKREWVLKELRQKFDDAEVKETNYKNLFGFSALTVIFILVLAWQRHAPQAYQIYELMEEYTPKDSTGSVIDPFTDWDSVISYIQTTLISPIWVDPKCGDSVCSAPFEFPGWGGEMIHGCAEDCGMELNLTKVVITMDFTAPTEGVFAEKLLYYPSHFSTTIRPSAFVGWNFCAFLTLPGATEKCWFTEHQKLFVGQVVTITINVADDNYYLDIEGAGKEYVRGFVHKEDTNCSIDDALKVICNATSAASSEVLDKDKLLQFEMCEYNTGADGTLTWRDYPFTSSIAVSDISTQNTTSPTLAPTLPFPIPTNISTRSPTPSPTVASLTFTTVNPTANPTPAASGSGRRRTLSRESGLMFEEERGVPATFPDKPARRFRLFQAAPPRPEAEESTDVCKNLIEPFYAGFSDASCYKYTQSFNADTNTCEVGVYEFLVNNGCTDGFLTDEKNVQLALGILKEPYPEPGNEAALGTVALSMNMSDLCASYCCQDANACQAVAATDGPVVRLVDGRTPWEGRVEVKQDNEWFSLCATKVTAITTMTVCRELGYGGFLRLHYQSTDTPLDPNTGFTGSKFPPLEDNMQFTIECKDLEASVRQCSLEPLDAPNSPDAEYDTGAECKESKTGGYYAVQCLPPEGYAQEVCAYGADNCCDPSCVPAANAFNDLRDTPSLSFQASTDLLYQTQCTEFSGGIVPMLEYCENTKSVAVENNGVCDALCNTQACSLDGWDCCGENNILDAKSGHAADCCSPTAPVLVVPLWAYREDDTQTKVTSFNREISNNRVIAGLVLHQTRGELDDNADRNKFADLNPYIYTGTFKENYGENPYFRVSSELYDDELTAKEANYTDEEIAAGDLHAFQHVSLKEYGYMDGFTVVFDVGQTATRAQDVIKYLQEALFVDRATKTLEVYMPMYNGAADAFVLFRYKFWKEAGGGIKWNHETAVVDMNLYDSTEDYVRLLFELIFVILIFYSAYSEGLDVVKSYRQTGNVFHAFSKYFWQMSNTLDAVSIFLNFLGIFLWISFVVTVEKFDIKLNYDADTKTKGRLLYKEENLRELAKDLGDLIELVYIYQLYLSVCGFNLILFLLRIFKLMHFQPNIGIVTRTVLQALPDLMHFAILLSIILTIYAVVGHVIFGAIIEEFSSMSWAYYTVFHMMLGDFTDAAYLLLRRQTFDMGMLAIPAVLFYYSFMSIVFLVVLNFLLAIVVDSFADVKKQTSLENAGHNSTMFREIADLAHDKFLYACSRKYRSERAPRVVAEKLARLEATEDKEITLRSVKVLEDDDKEEEGGTSNESVVFASVSRELDEPPSLLPLKSISRMQFEEEARQKGVVKKAVMVMDDRYKVMLDAKMMTTVLLHGNEHEEVNSLLAELVDGVLTHYGNNFTFEQLEHPVISKIDDPTHKKTLDLEKHIHLMMAHQNSLLEMINSQKEEFREVKGQLSDMKEQQASATASIKAATAAMAAATRQYTAGYSNL